VCSSPQILSELFLINHMRSFLIRSIWNLFIYRTPRTPDRTPWEPVGFQIATLINGYNDWHLQKVPGVDNVLASVVMTANRIWEREREPAGSWGWFLGSHWTIYAWPCSIYIIYNSQLDFLFVFSATAMPFPITWLCSAVFVRLK